VAPVEGQRTQHQPALLLADNALSHPDEIAGYLARIDQLSTASRCRVLGRGARCRPDAPAPSRRGCQYRSSEGQEEPAVGVDLRGEVVVRKKFSPKQLLHFTANLQVKLIGMEACAGSHFLGRGSFLQSKVISKGWRPRTAWAPQSGWGMTSTGARSSHHGILIKDKQFSSLRRKCQPIQIIQALPR
jgi:hypothetical protein